MNRNYDKHSKVKDDIWKVHKYLGVNFYFTEKGKIKIKIDNYVENMINELPTKISNSDTAWAPDGNNIFEKGNIKRLGKTETE